MVALAFHRRWSVSVKAFFSGGPFDSFEILRPQIICQQFYMHNMAGWPIALNPTWADGGTYWRAGKNISESHWYYIWWPTIWSAHG